MSAPRNSNAPIPVSLEEADAIVGGGAHGSETDEKKVGSTDTNKRDSVNLTDNDDD